MRFSIGQILSVTTGVLACKSMSDVYEILNFMTQDDLQTLALPRAANEVRPYIQEQLPWTKDIVADQIAGPRVFELLKPFTELYGEFHELHSMPAEDHENLDPAEDARRLGFKGEIINFELPDDDEPSPTGDINWKL